jgi:two-component sensor histidine kinase
MATTIARGEMLHGLLIDELNHRVKNTLAIMQSIAATFRSASRAEREKFEDGFGALAEAHNLLSQERWQDADLQDIVARVLQPHRLNNPDRVRMFGPKVPLSPRLAVVLSMILHEIATNAAKYGALSNDSGTVTLDWEVVDESDGRKLRMIWTESGGPTCHRAGPARLRIAADRTQRPRSARRRGHRRLPAPRRRLHRDLRARRRELIQSGFASSSRNV